MSSVMSLRMEFYFEWCDVTQDGVPCVNSDVLVQNQSARWGPLNCCWPSSFWGTLEPSDKLEEWNHLKQAPFRSDPLSSRFYKWVNGDTPGRFCASGIVMKSMSFKWFMIASEWKARRGSCGGGGRKVGKRRRGVRVGVQFWSILREFDFYTTVP